MTDPAAMAQDAAAFDGPGANRPVIRDTARLTASRNCLLACAVVAGFLVVAVIVATADCAGCGL